MRLLMDHQFKRKKLRAVIRMKKQRHLVGNLRTTKNLMPRIRMSRPKKSIQFWVVFGTKILFLLEVPQKTWMIKRSQIRKKVVHHCQKKPKGKVAKWWNQGMFSLFWSGYVKVHIQGVPPINTHIWFQFLTFLIVLSKKNLICNFNPNGLT